MTDEEKKRQKLTEEEIERANNIAIEAKNAHDKFKERIKKETEVCTDLYGIYEYNSYKSDFLGVCKPYVNHVDEYEGKVIEDFELKQNYPNPFNPTTTIEYSLPRAGYVKIMIYDVLGKEIKSLFEGYKDVGNYKLVWDGKDNSGNQVASGLYFYQMLAGDFNAVKRLLLQK